MLRRSQAFARALLLLLLCSCGIKRSVNHRADLSGYNDQVPEVRMLNSDGTIRRCGDDHLLRNDHGLWEMKLHGDPLELGLREGALTQDLYQRQESIFFKKVQEMVPSEKKQRTLIKFLAWFNRKMYQHVTNEYLAEIQGLSRYAGDEFDDVAPDNMRLLYLHGAHDIGHAVEQLALVDCSSFAAWGERTSDGELILGRNFDFYVGEGFAENRIVAFVEPEQGHRFMSLTWPGMIGVVSGMNEQGLTVTMNSGRSGIPLMAKTPISIVAREILQYASNIDEAVAIANQREVFVSESLLIGSAKDGRAAVIELAPRKSDVYRVANGNHLTCANHFQGEAFAKDRRNKKQIAESHTQFRFDRMEELIGDAPKIDPALVAGILRDRGGVGGSELGNGNEMAINQLLAHHSIIFKPASKQVWISTPPYQLGEYIAYDLDEVFAPQADDSLRSYVIDGLAIPEDPFVHSKEFDDYELYREKRTALQKALEKETTVLDAEAILLLNPTSWEAHYLYGAYQYDHEEYAEATEHLQRALELPIPYLNDKENIEKLLRKSRKKAKH